jgi:hypothetical protein
MQLTLRLTISMIALIAGLGSTASAEDFSFIDGQFITIEHLHEAQTQTSEMSTPAGSLPPMVNETEDEFLVTLRVLDKKSLITWQAGSFFCQVSNNYQQTAILYRPGRTESGTGTCDEIKNGTDVEYRIDYPTSYTYTGIAEIDGSEIHLKGSLSADLKRLHRTAEGPFAGSAEYVTHTEVTQEATLKFTEGNCEVLSLRWVTTTEEVGDTLNASGATGHHVTTFVTTHTNDGKTTCRME